MTPPILVSIYTAARTSMTVAVGNRRRKAKITALIVLGKRFLAFLFSHVGLCALMIAYTMLGAALFRAIEGPHERDIHQYVRQSRAKALNGVWKSTFYYNAKLEIWESNVSAELLEFKGALLRIIQKGYDANDQEDNTQWTFSGAFLYSLTVITTIGYGNIACRTAFGKAMTIVYAILGIPLMLLFLTNIGDILAKMFKFLYRKTVRLRVRFETWNRKSKFRKSPRSISIANAARAMHQAQSQQLLLASPPLQHETTPETPDHKRKRRKSTGLKGPEGPRLETPGPASAQISPRLSAGSIKRKSPGPVQRSNYQSIAVDESEPRQRSSVPEMSLNAGVGGDSAVETYAFDELSMIDAVDEKLEKLTVPLWLVLLTMLAYLMAGATLFHVWEGWSFFNSFYFCYVSLATIGFGDLFPGSSLKDAGSSQEKLIITSLFLLLGMALIAMCFNLAQEEVVNKMTRVAGKLGIIHTSDQDVSVYETD